MPPSVSVVRTRVRFYFLAYIFHTKFFLYANFQRSQKHHCLPLLRTLLRNTRAFPGMSLTTFNKLAARVSDRV